MKKLRTNVEYTEREKVKNLIQKRKAGVSISCKNKENNVNKNRIKKLRQEEFYKQK